LVYATALQQQRQQGVLLHILFYGNPEGKQLQVSQGNVPEHIRLQLLTTMAVQFNKQLI
jgi:hypothetical protein